MRIIEVRINQANFGEILGEIEQWLIRKNRPTVQFEFETVFNGDISIKFTFEANDLADQFRQAFRGPYGA